jgi:serine protease Do
MRRIDVFFIIALIIVGIMLFNKYYDKEREVPDVLIQEPIIREEKTPGKPPQDPQQEKQSELQELLISRRNAITDAVEKVQPAVVSVNVIKTQVRRRIFNPFFGFFDETPYQVRSIGSGMIFSDDGYIMTNAHVVEDATEIKILLEDERQFEAELIGYDNVHDLAILKISSDELPTAVLGDSDDLIIGEWSIALGNPYAYLMKDSKPSVSVGVISALNRDFSQERDGRIYRRMIQTDAAINQGNSGGPLVNIFGEVIGINTFIFTETGGNIGLGFAIPINRAKRIASELIRFGEVRRVWFGFRVQDLNPMLMSYLDLDSEDGVMVASVERGSPAAEAGLQRGDVITEINNNKIRNTEDAELAVTDMKVGDTILLTLIRDGEKLTISYEAKEYK